MAFTFFNSLILFLTSPPKHGDTASRPPYDHLAQDSNSEALHVDIPLPGMTCTLRTMSGRSRNSRKRDMIPLEMWSRCEGTGDAKEARKTSLDSDSIGSPISGMSREGEGSECSRAASDLCESDSLDRAECPNPRSKHQNHLPLPDDDLIE